MKKLVFSLGLLALTGCSSITTHGYITSITTRTIGFRVTATSSTTGTPEVDFGFMSSVIVMEPTSTNGPIFAPNYANTFDFTQQSALNLGIAEGVVSGNYQTTDGTNTTTQPIVPK